MDFPKQFVSAGEDYTTYHRFVPAPYFRKTFFADAAECRLRVTGLGFYRVWINGREITKGLLAPYISNPDDLVYFDDYDLSPHILPNAENALGFQLGNGMQNAPGGATWDFDKAPFRSAPKLAFLLRVGEKRIEADESVKTAPSPLYFDDLRAGARYDARKETGDWGLPGFDDGAWANAVRCAAPRGAFRVCEADPVRPTGEELRAVSIRPGRLRDYTPREDVERVTVPEDAGDGREGFLYDFGRNDAGVVRLKINGRPGQRIVLQFGELMTDGEPDYGNILFYPDGFAQRDVYICKGGEETFEPPFTYHGFRWCLVTGIDEAQATEELLTFVVCSSAKKAGGFVCSDQTANAVYAMCEASDFSNFYYYPTDCPHREKVGWTGDAAISAEHMLMTMKIGGSLKEWMRSIRAAQRESGEVPGMVPACNWPYQWGNGPVWDAALIAVPYYTYRYTWDREILSENAGAISRYLRYAAGRRNADGLIDYGLGDWCPIGGEVKPTVAFTGSVTLKALADMAAFIYETLGLTEEKAFAERLSRELRGAVRAKLTDCKNGIADTGSETAEAMALRYGLFEGPEREKAAARLIEAIRENGGFLDVGILGARSIFHVLSEFGESDLAWDLITRKEFPSYGALIALGETTLPEFFRLPGEGYCSHNHHMFGDVKNWFISCVAGLRYNPDARDHRRVQVRPAFIGGLAFAEAYFESPLGRISVRWERKDDGVVLSVNTPAGIAADVIGPDGARFAHSGEKVYVYKTVGTA